MNLTLNTDLASSYKNKSQAIRIMTEAWVKKEAFCPHCGVDITRFHNNRPVADYFCEQCHEQFELKSKKDTVGKKIVDGAYSTMIERLNSDTNPNFFLLQYCANTFRIQNFIVVPKQFFTPEIIEKRKPLSSNARRSGWVGCNIVLSGIPNSGKIYYIADGSIVEKKQIIANWRKINVLRNEKNASMRGWILDVMKCIDSIGKREFSLKELYFFENVLRLKHPENKHIKDKIRQQLQYLRDCGYLQFLGNGSYRLR